MPRVDLAEAIRLLRAGALVGVPTETVYGLAAHARDAGAVGAIFAAKGRPATHPLIVHGPDDPDAFGVADARARALAAAFWPGPLTLVLPKRPDVPDAVTGGHPTVAVRSPAHPLARALAAALPFAAPSANRFGQLSPTTAEHVAASFPALPVLDGGPCEVGVESTIVDLTGPAALLRPGGVPVEAIEALIGPVRRGGATAAPGNLAAHYAPRAALVATDDPEREAARHRAAGRRVEVLRALPAAAYAHALYAALRALDARAPEVIVAEWADRGGLGEAVNDRSAGPPPPEAHMGIRDCIKGALGLGARTHLAEGAAAPEIGVADANGKVWTLADLRGRAAVIYFYPKDDTPGCTREACAFRDSAARLGDAAVLGVSADSAQSHRAFAQKFNLGFPLLADTSGALAARWGAAGNLVPRRVTFVLDREGRIARVFDPVKVDGHADEVIAALRDLP